MIRIHEYLINNHIKNKKTTPYYISKDRTNGAKHEFSSDELEELMNYIENDEDFVGLYNSINNQNFDSLQDAIKYFESFLDEDIYYDCNDKSEAHAFYILDDEIHTGGCSYIKLSTGKLVNMDKIYNEFNSILKSV